MNHDDYLLYQQHFCSRKSLELSLAQLLFMLISSMLVKIASVLESQGRDFLVLGTLFGDLRDQVDSARTEAGQ